VSRAAELAPWFFVTGVVMGFAALLGLAVHNVYLMQQLDECRTEQEKGLER